MRYLHLNDTCTLNDKMAEDWQLVMCAVMMVNGV